MPDKIKFIPDEDSVDFTPDDEDNNEPLMSLNLNDITQLKLQPHQWVGLDKNEAARSVTTGPNPPEERGVLGKIWDALNYEIIGATPQMKTAMEEFNKEHPIAAIPGRLAYGAAGSVTPLNIGLGALSEARPLAELAGMYKTAKGISGVSRFAGAGFGGLGIKDAYEGITNPELDTYGKVGAGLAGGLQALMGTHSALSKGKVAPERPIDSRLREILNQPIQPLPRPVKGLLPPHTGMIADERGLVIPNKPVSGPLGELISPEVAASNFTPDAQMQLSSLDKLRRAVLARKDELGLAEPERVTESSPLRLTFAEKPGIKLEPPSKPRILGIERVPDYITPELPSAVKGNKIDFVPDNVTPGVSATPSIISQSTSDKLADLTKRLFTETEGSFKPKELAEGIQKLGLKLRGKKQSEVDTIRTNLLDHLVNVGRIDVNDIYSKVSDKLSPSQFDKVLNDIIDSGDLQKAYKSKTAVGKGIVPAARNMRPASLEDSLASLSDAIGQHQQARLQQDEIVRGEKAQRASKLETLKGQGYEGYQQQREALKGAYFKVDVKPIIEAASSVNMDEMMNMVDSKLPDQFQAFRAKTAISKVFGLSEMKSALQPSELDLLTKVFGPELTAKLQQMNSVFGMPDGEYSQVGKDLARYSNLAKSIQASMDLSAPLRQGAPLAGRKEFWPAAYNMFKYAGSEKTYKVLQNYLSTEWKHRDLAKAARLAITRIGSDMNELPKEEHFLSELPERVPGLGKLYRGSERAYVGFLDKLRADTYSSLVGDLERAGIKTYDTVKINSRDKTTGKMITVDKVVPTQEVLDTAKFINTATGRGSLGAAEKYGDLLNTIFYSPRFQASRLDLMTKFLRPDTYTKLSPALRTEYLRALLSMGGIAATINGLGYAVGGKLTSDPRSSDFGKVIYHDKTRQDPGAGFLQYLTLAARMVTNQTTSTRTGKVSEMGEKFGSSDRLDTLGRFTRNKLSPIPGLAVSAIKGKNPIGEEFSLLDETGKLMVPLLIQDINEILKNDPKAYPLIVPATLGQGIQVYKDLQKKQQKKQGSFLGRQLKRDLNP